MPEFGQLKQHETVDVDALALIENFPQLKDLPPQEAQIVMLYVAGMTPKAIGQYLDLSPQAVILVLNKHDFTKAMRRGLEMQKLLIANSIGAIMVSSILQIKRRAQEFERLSLPQIMQLVKT